MEHENNPQFEQQAPANSYPQGQKPIAPPKQKKKHGCLIAVLIVVAVVCAAYSLYHAYRSLNVHIDRSENGFSITVGREAEPAPETPPVQPQPDVQNAETPPPETLRGDAKLTISDSPLSAPNRISSENGALSLQEIYEKMIPSVVSIVTDVGSGTGIIMSEDGFLITNYHVIDGADDVAAIVYTEKTYGAALVGGDEASDLAVLKIEPQETLIPAEFGNSDALRVGDSVVAIGDPLGTKLRGTMTNGIISAINRDLFVNDREMTLIQTNAALNNGNSGGPLINCYGQVVGINAVKLSASYFSASIEGLGFAIPITGAKPIIDELIANGYVSGRPAVGIIGESLPLAVRTYYRLPEGVYVSYVDPESDAYAQGVTEGDIITAADGTAISSIDRLDSVKNQFQAGQTLTLTLYSRGEYRDVTITLMDAALVHTN